MATSGSFQTSVRDDHYILRVDWTASQSVADNTSTITAKVYFINTWSIDIAGRTGNTLTIAGKSYSFDTGSISTKGTHLLATITSDAIPHNADGSKTIAMSCSWKMLAYITANGETTYHGTLTAQDGSVVLTTIPRASQPSCITWPEHTQDVGYFGDTISIHMNRKSNTFKHTVRYAFGNLTGTCINADTGKATNKDVEDGFTWKIPESLMNLIPNTTSGSGTIYVDTYNGNTLIGTKYCGFTALVPASVKPKCSATLEDVSGVGDIYGTPVQSLSRIRVTVNVTPAYSSPITSYLININGVSYTTAEATTGVLIKSGSSPVTVTVADSRGRTSDVWSYNMSVQEYTPPVISSLSVRRCNEDDTANDEGEFAQVTFSATVKSMNSKNTAAYVLRYKKTADTSFNEVPLSKLNNTYAVSNFSYRFPADSNNAYNIEVTVNDRHNTYARTTNVSTAFALMHFGADGTSVGLLKIAERSGAVDVGGDIHLNGNVLWGSQGVFDTRATNETPSWYMANAAKYVAGVGSGSTIWEFKLLTAIGFTAPSATFAPVQTIIPWGDESGGLPRQIAYEGRTKWTRIANSVDAWGAWQSENLLAYPVNSIYISYSHTSPASLFGGTWTRITNAFLWADGGTGTIGQTGGEYNHTLTVNELPPHSHGAVYSQNATGTKEFGWYTTYGDKLAYGGVLTGDGYSHNNMPPYIQVSVWRRTA